MNCGVKTLLSPRKRPFALTGTVQKRGVRRRNSALGNTVRAHSRLGWALRRPASGPGRRWFKSTRSGHSFSHSLNAYGPLELSGSNTPKVFGFEISQQNQQLDLAGGCNAIIPRDFVVRGSCSIPTAPTKPHENKDF